MEMAFRAARFCRVEMLDELDDAALEVKFAHLERVGALVGER